MIFLLLNLSLLWLECFSFNTFRKIFSNEGVVWKIPTTYGAGLASNSGSRYKKLNCEPKEYFEDALSSPNLYRRSMLQNIIHSVVVINAITLHALSPAIGDTYNENSESGVGNLKPKITQKAYLDLKIANYTEESVGKNRGAYGSGRVVFGLYGKDAPKSVDVFLRSILSDGKTVPSFINSQFSRVTEEGVLELERVRGLNTVRIAGSDQYEFGGEVLDYQPILESNSIRHSRAGLLTRRQLSAGPLFGITLRKSEDLDSFHVVFGEVLEGMEVIDAISNIPIYTYSTATGYGGKEKGVEGDLADKWFSAQKSLFVTAGKTFGDKRAVDRRGQPLRRISIKGAGVLNNS